MKHVYFIRPIGMDGPVKIGVTGDVGRRLQDLLKWSPVDLEVIATTPGDFHLEARIHRMLAASHKHKEWFHWSDQLGRLIASVVAGDFDARMLPEDARPLWFERHAWILKQRRHADDLLQAAVARKAPANQQVAA